MNPIERFPIPERWLAPLLRAGTAFPFLLGMALTNLGWNSQLTLRLWSALGGLVLVAALARIWGERTRPKNTWGWGFLGLGWLAFMVYGAFAGPADAGATAAFAFGAGLLVGAALSHDLGVTPSLMVSMVTLSTLSEYNRLAASANEGMAWWVGLAVLIGLAAAVLERERLALREGNATPWSGIAFRLGFVTAWTVLVLTFRKQLQTGQLFAWLGADPTTTEGQLFFIALALAAILAAALFFRTGRSKPQAEPPVAP